MKKNVLVFPCGSEIGLEIHKSLSFSTHFNLIGGSSVEDHGKYIYQNYISDLPFITDPDFSSRLNKVIKTHNIDFIIPAHDSVVLRLAQEQAAGRVGCSIITSPLPTCDVARSKLATYKYFEGKIPTPKIYDDIKDSDLPLFLKPDVGQGSKGTYLAKDLSDVEFYRKKDPTLLVLEYLPGKEYTIDCFTDRNGDLLFCEGRERRRIQNGISVNSTTIEHPRFQEIATILNDNLEFQGVWFFQVKEDATGELVLMEIAPRIAGTMGLVRCKGVNLVLLSLFDALGYDVDIFENNINMVIDRALENRYEHNFTYHRVYLDLDDLLIFEGKVNPFVMAFVFQCLNRSIKVQLLTRHKDNLAETLKKYRIDGIFDDIVWVKQGEEKHPYITAHDAIFIDDSFAERKKVHEQCGIPTFDSHMLESLVEKF